MNVDLSLYAGKRICVAVSGGKDSMALLHYISVHGKQFDITLCALNCDHGIRGEQSKSDSAFVADFCRDKGIPLFSFAAEEGRFSSENGARVWRLGCYRKILAEGRADLVATAHHSSDNAETVLFNLARGSALNGLTGISDSVSLGLIRPLIACERSEIDGYIESNGIPFVTDESNFERDYTRNKIRLDVLPALEAAVPSAVKNIYNFSRLAAEDEEYFARQADKLVVERKGCGYLIKPCEERVIFKRAAQKIAAKFFGRKDYTSAHFEKLFALQFAGNGKKFEFLNLVAVKEEGGVFIAEACAADGSAEVPFGEVFGDGNATDFCGVTFVADLKSNLAGAVEKAKEGLAGAVETFESSLAAPVKILRFDLDKIPQGAVVRFKRAGDTFKKFGGGSKSLGDYLTDKKVPQGVRGRLPLVCDGSEVLIVGGVEISDKVKTDGKTVREGVLVCADYSGCAN